MRIPSEENWKTTLFPSSWQRRYQRLAKETQLHLHDFQEAAQAADAFVTPVISGQVVDLTWDPEYWCWKKKAMNFFKQSGSTQFRLGALC